MNDLTEYYDVKTAAARISKARVCSRETGIFLDTPSRRKLTEKLPVVSVPVLGEGVYQKEEMPGLLGDALD